MGGFEHGRCAPCVGVQEGSEADRSPATSLSANGVHFSVACSLNYLACFIQSVIFWGAAVAIKSTMYLLFSPYFGANTTTATAKRLSRRIVP